MTDRDEIIRAFNAKQAEADKILGPDHRSIAEAVANELRISYEDVREVLLDHWSSPMRAG